MSRIFITVALAFLLLELAASQSCQDAINAAANCTVTEGANCSAGDCLAAYANVSSQCTPQVGLIVVYIAIVYIAIYSDVHAWPHAVIRVLN